MNSICSLLFGVLLYFLCYFEYCEDLHLCHSETAYIGGSVSAHTTINNILITIVIIIYKFTPQNQLSVILQLNELHINSSQIFSRVFV